ncbi:MAG: single-stranded DNA-binding protein [Mariprofundales bacterium]
MITTSLSGRMAFDPREISTKSGKPMTTARLACDDEAGNTLWIDLVTFGGHAEWLARAMKGDRIAAMGRMGMNKWTGQDGTEHELLQLTVDSIMVPAPKPTKRKPKESQRPPPAPTQPTQPPVDDDIPF